MSLHKNLTSDDIHIIYAFSYTNSATRLSATGFTASDIGKIARQTDDNTFWILTNNVGPVWSSVHSIDIAGDLGGTPTNPLVIKIQGNPVNNLAPTDGYVLTWDQADGYWLPKPTGAVSITPDATATVKGKIKLAGDLDGTADLPSVIKIQGNPVNSVAPIDGYVLTWDQADGYWLPKAPTSTLATGRVFKFANSASDISTYLNITDNVIGIEVDATATGSSASGEILIKAFSTPLGSPNLIVLPAGLWDFNYFCYMDSNASVSQIRFKVYIRTVGGTETLLFSVTSDDINDISLTSVQSILSYNYPTNTDINSTDRIVVKVYGITTSGGTRTFHFVFDGTVHASHFHSPIVGGGFEVAGDISGTIANATVVKLQNRSINAVAPIDGYVLTWDQADGYWYPKALPSSIPTGPAGGDLTGTYPNPTINSLTKATDIDATINSSRSLRIGDGYIAIGTIPAVSTGVIRLPYNTGIATRNAGNTADNLLVSNASGAIQLSSYLANTTILASLSLNINTNSGHVSTLSQETRNSVIHNNFYGGRPTIFGIGTLASDQVPQDGYFKSSTPFASATGTNRNSGNIIFEIPAPISGGVAGVIKANVNTSTPLIIGDGYVQLGGTVAPALTGDLRVKQGYKWVGRNATNTLDKVLWEWGTASDTLNSSSFVSLSAGVSITGSTIINGAVQYGTGFSPTHTQAAISGNAHTFTIAAQSSNAANGNGGALILQSGQHNGSGLGGALQFTMDGYITIEQANVVAGQRIIALNRSTAITSTQMPTNTGDLVTYIGDAATKPTANPVSGLIMYSTAGKFGVRSSAGGQFESDFTTAATATNGTGEAVKTNVEGYIIVNIGGVDVKVPYYKT